MSFAEGRAWLSGMNPKISLAELFPRSFDRWRTLPIFAHHLDDLVHWLQDSELLQCIGQELPECVPKGGALAAAQRGQISGALK